LLQNNIKQGEFKFIPGGGARPPPMPLGCFAPPPPPPPGGRRIAAWLPVRPFAVNSRANPLSPPVWVLVSATYPLRPKLPCCVLTEAILPLGGIHCSSSATIVVDIRCARPVAAQPHPADGGIFLRVYCRIAGATGLAGGVHEMGEPPIAKLQVLRPLW